MIGVAPFSMFPSFHVSFSILNPWMASSWMPCPVWDIWRSCGWRVPCRRRLLLATALKCSRSMAAWSWPQGFSTFSHIFFHNSFFILAFFHLVYQDVKMSTCPIRLNKTHEFLCLWTGCDPWQRSPKFGGGNLQAGSGNSVVAMFFLQQAEFLEVVVFEKGLGFLVVVQRCMMMYVCFAEFPRKSSWILVTSKSWLKKTCTVTPLPELTRQHVDAWRFTTRCSEESLGWVLLQNQVWRRILHCHFSPSIHFALVWCWSDCTERWVRVKWMSRCVA